MNTKLVLGLPKTKQEGLEQAKKNLRRCERWLAEPPPRYKHAHRFISFSKASVRKPKPKKKNPDILISRNRKLKPNLLVV